jgi:hypothetical protein
MVGFIELSQRYFNMKLHVESGTSKTNYTDIKEINILTAVTMNSTRIYWTRKDGVHTDILVPAEVTSWFNITEDDTPS